jgi:threonine dehydrogenase-like Zn-dependent dehydrogenase
LSVVEDPLSEAEQALTVEHESVMVEVDAVLALEGVNTEYDMSQALVVLMLQPEIVVVADAESEPEQAVIVEHLPVTVDVEAVLAPEGVKTEYVVSQALVVCAEQELLDPLDLDPVEEAV